jgi:lysyl-tRNA synthetase class 2
LDSLGFIEVETPMMQPIAGGATARPFKTFHNALGMDFYLRIAPELYLKRLIVGGMERVYEINRNFRNEGVSTQHNPEFTMLEFYQAYSDFRDLMTLTEEMLTQVVEKIHGDREIEYAGKKVSFDRWQRLTIKQAIIKYWGLPNESFGMKMATPPPSEEELSSPQLFDQLLNQPSLVLPIRSDIPVSAGPLVLPSELTHGEKLIHLFEHVAEEHLIDPTFIYEFPVEISPLSKTKPDDPATVERFELFVGGLEIANAYSELNDPLEQYMRFEEQVRNRQKGNEEAHAMDEDYIRALGYGMPPTAGEGIGIDRFVMLLTDSRSIRDVILFPHLRPEHGRPTEEQQPSADS